jgi:hypothetical protein
LCQDFTKETEDIISVKEDVDKETKRKERKRKDDREKDYVNVGKEERKMMKKECCTKMIYRPQARSIICTCPGRRFAKVL